ncbi:uncharacterized protein [Linepithema humile]|uniref:uncharacterized protein n=1 Tax=Linepithema humile TaxID=83485 RepID=UPI00351F57CE
MKKWTIVLFLRENDVEAVPVNWLNGDVCYWPPYNTHKVGKAISSCEDPDISTWTLHEIRKLGKGCNYDSLIEAKNKAKRAEDTSDINNSEKENSKRISKKPKFFYETLDVQSASDDDISMSENDLTEIPMELPLSPAFSSTISSVDLSAGFVKSLKPISKRESATLKQSLITSPSLTNNNVEDAKECTFQKSPSNDRRSQTFQLKSRTKPTYDDNFNFSNENSRNNTIAQNTKHDILQKKSRSSGNVNNSTLSDDAFKTQVLRQLQILDVRQKQLSEDIATLSTMLTPIMDKMDGFFNGNKILNDENIIPIFSQFTFPLKNADDLKNLEDFLVEKEHFDHFVKELKIIGDSTYKVMLKRILPMVFSNQLAQTFSWYGKKGNENFSLLKICSAISGAVEKTHRCTLADIQSVVSNWLVKATERVNKKSVRQAHEKDRNEN